MKQLAGLLLLLLLCTTLFPSCSEDDISDTNKYINELNTKLPSCSRKNIDLTGVGELNGNIAGYFTAGELVQATVSTYYETYSKTETYYFKSGDLVCLQKQEFTYNRPRSLTQEVAEKSGDSTWYDEKKTTVKTKLFYFYDKRMVKWINESKKEVPETDKNYQFVAASILSDAEKLEKMFRE
ncbi:MAG: hypothetical protein EBZ77_05130 [Chitinophagia bacterium]|nr:hypothetical protein [Chitinophagia bacterium]